MAANTTYTSNFQIKLIGTGREAGTWGSSTNETIQRLEAALGRTVEINVQAMPLGSVNADVSTTWVATWITADSSDSGLSEPGSEGRSASVDVIDSGSLAQNPTLRIRGSSDTETPARVLFIKNSLTTHDLIVNGSGTNYTIKNGAFAIVAVVPTAVSSHYTIGVHNLIRSLQLEDIIFSGTGEIVLDPSLASAFSITDGTNEYISIDTDTQQINVHQTVSTVPTALDVEIKTNDANALDITDGTTSFIKLDSSTLDKRVKIGTALTLENLDLNSALVPLYWTLKPNDLNALRLASSAGVLLNIKAAGTVALSRVEATSPITAPNIGLTGSNSYIEFDNDGTSDFQSGSYGIRNNGGIPEVKASGGSWADILQGEFFTALTDATAEVSLGVSHVSDPSLEQRKFSFNIGPLRFCTDTIRFATNTNTTIVVDVNSEVYTVMACLSSLENDNGTMKAWVSDMSAKEITIDINVLAPITVTYWAIGDSGL